jgi:hypothetical protein
MTFLEQLQAHKGGLVQLKTELYWYAQGRHDGNPGRVCLILDATSTAASSVAAVATVAYEATAVAAAAALLLVDGSPRWVWIAKEDVEFL